jgi:hypothetical protein
MSLALAAPSLLTDSPGRARSLLTPLRLSETPEQITRYNSAAD